MTKVMTPEEYAAYSGCDLARLKAAIAEAEADAITRESMDPATLDPPKLSPEAEARAREFLRHAREGYPA